MKVEALKIFAKYLARDAPSLVNVNQSAVENLEKKLDKPNKEIFDVPQDQVGVKYFMYNFLFNPFTPRGTVKRDFKNNNRSCNFRAL